VRLDRRIERDVEQVLGAEVRRPAVDDAAVDGDELAVVDVGGVHAARLLDEARLLAQLGIVRLRFRVVVEVAVEDLDPHGAQPVCERVDVHRVVRELGVLLHHLFLAGGEGVAHLGLLEVDEDADLDPGARPLDEHALDLLPDRVVEEEEDGDVDGRARCSQVGKQHREGAMSVDEVLRPVPDHHRRGRYTQPQVGSRG